MTVPKVTKIVFHLAKHPSSDLVKLAEKSFNYKKIIPNKTLTLYKQIKMGLKTVEMRQVKKGFDDFWLKRLCRELTDREKTDLPLDLSACEQCAVNFTSFLKVKKAWFVQGYPKGNIPRIEADIDELLLFPQADACRVEIVFSNPMEVSK